ncbi:MAG: tRNA lysidine(34) synthetase TilS [Dysgonamonadaceae bacterium]|jgi:tRNA(Ile)-lysidine synthase|nr:tRNA lysidine(34) synthetase TilS [Dysgonamonadaceae bacterium]
MIRKIRQYIEKRHLLDAGDKVIVGLSGGSDSVVLLSILHRLGYDCLAAHCNFHLRGEEALRDEQHSIAFAQSLKIPCFKQDFDTLSIARQRGISIEMAARDLRYEWFEQLRRDQNAHAIAVAHHRDDSVETLLLNLMRGTGIKGLTGIKSKNGFVVRPLLDVSKQDILQYAAEKQLPFVTDSSNREDEYMRNKIRLSALPLLRSIQPAIDSALIHTMENVNEAVKIYDFHIQEAIRNVFDRRNGTIHIGQLKTLPSPEAVLFELLKEYGFGRDTVQDIVLAMDKHSGKEFYSSEYGLIKDRDFFLLFPRSDAGEPLVEEIYKETVTEVAVDANFKIAKDRNIAYFDAEKLQFPLQIRPWKQGDKFMPFGMNQFQKLSDYFSTNKFSKPEKEKTRILCSGNDIIWIIGHRTDHRYRITEKTQKAVILKLF